ncbi:Rv3654c family TadE-like protein [Blastococcus sp. LR1]|uniref:Rv3654c family TadE-like protein n=1 Tax=Blastococcus sp. LR1 TaxID=2877000 RepID=UPI001CCAD69A|nr:Rv3654c family TadE-like protein [Blastococcus sp. LR1]MCA0144738.1 flp pilus-assembly TadE/G-like family protein [Blastococcus sp. LR1]
MSGERGSATVWVLILSAVLVTVAAAAVLSSLGVVARHRAATAADLAALAGASRAVVGDPDPCAAAAETAAANGAELTGCELEAGSIVSVEVRVALPLGRLGTHDARARARAGPVPL